MTLQITRTNLTQVDFSRVSGRSSSRAPILIIGPAAAASALAINTVQKCTSPQDAVDFCNHGPLVEAACHSLALENRRALIMRTAATGTPATYAAITTSFTDALAPTVAGDVASLPEDDLEPGVEFVAGGTLATAGITYRYRTGGALSVGLSGTLALGVATSITLPYGAGKYLLTAPLASLVARGADIRTKFLAHTAEFGVVHTIVDPNSPYTITTPIDQATLFTCCTNLRTSALNHVDELGTVHAVVDTAAQTLITALTTPTTLYGAQTFLAAFATAFFGDGATLNSGHTRRTSSAIHLAVDATNVLAAAGPACVITTGDSFTAETTNHRWSVAELGAALDVVALLPASQDFDGILLCGPVLSGIEEDAIAAKVEALRIGARWKRFSPHFRMRNTGESLSAYAIAYEAAFGTTTQRTSYGPAVSWYVQSSHPNRFGQVDVRPFNFAYMARLCTVREDINPTDESAPPVGFGSFVGYVRDPNAPSNVLPRAVDDGHTELLTPLRAIAPRTKKQVNEGIIFVGQGATLAPTGSDFYIAPYARSIDLACTTAFRPLEKRLGRKVKEAPDHTMDPNERKRIEAGITEDLSGPLVKSGVFDAVTVRLDPDALLNTPPPVVVGATITTKAGGYIDEWDVGVSLS